MRRPRRRAAGPSLRGALHDVAARARAAHGAVERDWFKRRWAAARRPRLYQTEEDPDGDFDGAVADPAVVEEAWRAWREEVASAETYVEEATDLGRRSTRSRARAVLDARGPRPHGRGVRAAQRPRGPAPRRSTAGSASELPHSAQTTHGMRLIYSCHEYAASSPSGRPRVRRLACCCRARGNDRLGVGSAGDQGQPAGASPT